ncbi:methyl-accepting chemotaxis protein [Nitrospira lenta]|uniref:Putative methyl-accepting chemotaxis protein n=1 Tax=Nitrospira lenta TaxID=1436998 RepID=A0A0K2GX64_9BACT|nr:methyl-accepting chemotaxis protein [Nitrospira lenta]ALA66370.1 putative methyl-accepting chemotaxis protein [Nitrospira lenta]SPP64260.1 putative methyl-accepting chemotaxis protein [Nitrospira lenta]
MSLQKIVTAIFAVTVLLLAGLCVAAVLMLQGQRTLEAAQVNRYESYLLADELRQGSDDLTRLARTYVITGNEKHEAEYFNILAVRNGVATRLDGQKVALRTLMQQAGFTEDEFRKLKEAEDNSNSLVTTETIAMNAVKGQFSDGQGGYTRKAAPDFEQARRIMFDDKYHQDKATIMAPVAEFVSMLDTRTKREVEEASAQSYEYLQSIIVMLMLLWVLQLASFLIIRHKVTKPVARLRDVTVQVAQGDLTIDISATSSRPSDEIGQLTQSFNKMVMDLRETLRQVAEMSHNVADASARISQSADHLARGAQEQTLQASGAAAAVQEMSKTISETSHNATETADAAKAAKAAAEKGGHGVNATIAGIRRISDVVNQSASTVQTLGRSSDQIGEIILVIDDIADQTNLLALNAAIEAARAGEQGRGFAVVADEVRKLAERTSKATKEIASMIKQIQGETSGAISAMDAGTKEMESGVELADLAGFALKEIVTNSQHVTDMIVQIALATEEQTVASGQIGMNMEVISRVIATTGEETQRIAGAASELDGLTVNLQTLIGRFKL